MPRRSCPVHAAFLASFLLLSCQPTPETIPPPSQNTLFLYGFERSVFLEFSEEFQLVKEIPFSFPVNCGLYDVFPAPRGAVLAVELICPNGQSVLFLDTVTGATTLPFPDLDSHFLAWQSDGLAAYLKADTLGNPRIIRVFVSGAQDILAVSEFTYDLAARPDPSEYSFTFSRGLGYGSELYLAGGDGRESRLIYGSSAEYISFARWSPDGKQIAFITIPDSQIPFTMGNLFVTRVDEVEPRWLGPADAGHGYAANWSPDGTRIAFVVRENPEDEEANRSSEALVSNIYIVDVASGQVTRLTFFEDGYAATPHWSPDGNTLAFNAVVDGRMTVVLADLASGEVKSLVTGSACCPAWMRK
jgi:hypothetical protein